MMDDADPQPHPYFLLGMTDNTQTWLPSDMNFSAATCTISSVENENCYAGYYKHFNSTPIGDRISTSVPTSSRKNSKPDYYSECVFVYSRFYESCRYCTSDYIDRTTKLSNLKFLVVVNEKNENLFHRISTASLNDICTGFMLLPAKSICRIVYIQKDRR